MKKLFFIIPLLFLFAFSYGQRADGQEFLDSLVTSSSLDTVIFTVTDAFDYDGICGFYVRADSISGATGATISYQGMPEGGSYWQTFDTDTVNGAGTTYYKFEGTAYFEKYRAFITAPSSTQTTYLYGTWQYKRKR